jgi:hypothetical protein
LAECFLKNAADDSGDDSFKALEQGGIRVVFHGTRHGVMEAILKSGLDPNFRHPHLREDYFGVDFGTSLHYTRNAMRITKARPTTLKLLVFMILDPTKVSGRFGYDLNVVTVASNAFELPIAEIALPPALNT